MEEHKRSRRDVHELHQEEHDETLNARRVTVVGDGKIDLDIDAKAVTKAFTEAIQAVDFNGNPRSGYSEEVRVIEVPKQVFVPQVETKIIEVPVQTLVTEYKVVEVEKPIVTEILKVVEIEKPLITKEYIEKVPAWAWALIVTQTAVLIGGVAYALLQLGVLNV